MTLAHLEDGVEVSASGTALVLKITGELDVTSRDAIEPALIAAVCSSSSVIIDLDGLSFCDSNGIAMFIAIQEKAVAQASHLEFRNVRGMVRRVFEITCLDMIVELDE
jgi:anti-sigma B factor antagonist